MNMELKGKVAVVIGAARGIGAATAAAFATEEAHVALLDRDESVWRTADDLQLRAQSRVVGMAVNATDFAAVREAAMQIEADIGPIDHLVYAAGAGSGKLGFPFWNLEPEDWDRVLQVNLLGAVNAAHAVAPGMAKRNAGTILFIASVAGQIGSQTDPPYSAAKAGVINFTQCAARDLAPFGVRVNAISPGMVQTDLNRAVWQSWSDRQPESERISYEEWGMDKVRRVSPMGRWQTPQEMAAMAVYLASPHARNVTGQTLNVDGGQVMHS